MPKQNGFLLYVLARVSLSSGGDGFGQEQPAKESSFCNRVNADVLQKE